MIRHTSVIGLFALAVLASAPARAQRPVINMNGVVNAASFVPAPKPGHALAPGSIASVFGRNLAAATATADGFPLPTMLAGSSITVDGRPAHLFFVSPGQINFQIPEGTGRGDTFSDFHRVPVIISTATGASDPVMIDIFLAAPGVFTLEGNGCGRGAILNVKADGTVSVNSPSNSAAPGDVLEIFGTGLGPPVRTPELFRDGEAAPNVPSQFSGGASMDGVGVDVYPFFFAGRAPGQVGVDQINAPVTAEVRDGCAVPLRVGGRAGMSSQPVLVSIHRGGGQCADPSVESFGEIVWQKEIIANTSPPGETDTFMASFPASPGRRMPPAEGSDNPMSGYRGPSYTAPLPPSCPIPDYRNVDVGDLILQAPGVEPIRVSAVGDAVEARYRATLPPGTVRAGSFGVSAAGGSGVGLFRTDIQIGAGVQITSPFPPGSEVRFDRPVIVTWTGGEPGSVVRVRLIAHGALQDAYLESQVPVQTGAVTFTPPSNFGQVRSLPLPGLPDREIVVDVFPNPSQVASFSAQGLTLGGRHTWMYRYRFPGLK
jgi:uncharacterized protein (TIGR03437 family)